MTEDMTKCPECGGRWTHAQNGFFSTSIGFVSPPGHHHDPNCIKRVYACENGHLRSLSVYNKCPACDWKNQDTCFCHAGNKLDEWPIVDEKYL